MRALLACCIAIFSLLCRPAFAEEVQFDGGWLRCSWSVDSQYLLIQATIDTPSSPGETHTWILTAYGHRFEDGIFAWQIHYSETVDSVLVLPNDFLTARYFTTGQLGIETELAPSGIELNVRIPILGIIPRLVATGDLIELHALWIQQAPLVAMHVPAPEELTALLAGGGAAIPEPDGEPISSSPLPQVDSFQQGQPISHRFILQEHIGPDGPQRIVLTYSLMRVHVGKPAEFARFAHVSYDSDTDTYSYAIDTLALAPGRYTLLIGSSNSVLSYRMELEIVEPIE